MKMNPEPLLDQTTLTTLSAYLLREGGVDLLLQPFHDVRV